MIHTIVTNLRCPQDQGLHHALGEVQPGLAWTLSHMLSSVVYIHPERHSIN